MSTQEAVRHVEGEVRELIRRSGIDPTSNTLEVRRLVQDAVQDYDERSLHGGLQAFNGPSPIGPCAPPVEFGTQRDDFADRDDRRSLDRGVTRGRFRFCQSRQRFTTTR